MAMTKKGWVIILRDFSHVIVCEKEEVYKELMQSLDEDKKSSPYIGFYSELITEPFILYKK